MAKRRRVGSLTGGTQDVNPQWYRGQVQTLVGDTPRTLGFISPIAKGIFSKSGWATVMEILKVRIRFPAYPILAAAAETIRSRSMAFGTKDHGTDGVYLSTSDLFAYHEDGVVGAFTGAGTYCYYQPGIFEVDLTDEAGHGVLVGSDYIYVQGDTNGFGTTETFMFAILYRFKNVKLQEYIGIVQSQQ